MIKKLRIKLIFASIFSLFTVLLIILGIVGILSYRNLVTDADNTLQILAENNGRFPNQNDSPKEESLTDNIKREKHRVSPELPYESRYFSVILDSDGEVVAVNTGKIAAVDTAAAIRYGKEVWDKGKTSGFVNNYRYMRYIDEEDLQLIFLDCGRSLHSFRTFMLTGVFVSVVGLVTVFLLLIFLSARIVKPFSESYEKQKRFITDAGHELKTPLTIIDADIEVLEMDFGENEWLHDIQNQTQRLADLTQSLIMLARMEEEQMQVQMIEFPLSDIALETIETFQTLAKAQNKVINFQVQPMLSMIGDEKSIRQLLSILLDNAVKYSKEEGEISLILEKRKNQIWLCVYNTVEHVSKDKLPYLFDRFYRADQSRNSQTGGYGLGLSIAASIVNIHKGKIWADTQDEVSLTITAVFPR